MNSIKYAIANDGEITSHQRIQLRMDYIKTVGTLVAIFIPLTVAVITLIVTAVLASSRARADFELKALEVIMSSPDPGTATTKAKVLVELFPDRLDKTIPDTMERLYGRTP